MSINELLISALNRYLDLDPERANAIDSIDGCIIALRITELELLLQMGVKNKRLQLPVDERAADVLLEISMKVLPDLFLSVDSNQLMQSGAIMIEGDAHVASTFQHALRQIEIDWTGLIASYTGEAVAHRMGQGFDVLRGFMHRQHKNFKQDVRDHLQDNLHISAGASEVQQFIQDVDQLRADADRLEARIKRHERDR